MISLNKKARESLERFSEVLELPAEIPLSLQNSICMKKCPKTGRIRIVLKLAGDFPGENILVNRIGIGKALSPKVRVVSENGFTIAIKGEKIKEHGLEKLHNYEKRVLIDLAKFE